MPAKRQVVDPHRGGRCRPSAAAAVVTSGNAPIGVPADAPLPVQPPPTDRGPVAIDDRSVDLIYLDPPFNSNTTNNLPFKGKDRSIKPVQAFKDTWE